MTSSSELGFYRRFDPARFQTQKPVDTGQSRVLLNDLLHLQDVASQHRVNWRVRAAGDVRVPATVSATAFQPVTGGLFGPFPVTLRADGSPYGLVVRIAGKTSQTDLVTFRVAIGLLEEIAGLVAAADDRSCRDASTSSGTAAWLTNTAKPSGAADDVILLPNRAQYLTERVGESALVAGDSVTVQAAEVYAQVYAKTANVASTPQLAGLLVREFYG